MKNIYDKINDENFSFDDYEMKDLNDLEKKKYKKNFKKNISYKKKRFASVAAAFALVVGLMSTNFGQMAYAKAESALNDFTYSIKTAMDLNDNIEKYTSVVNKEVEDKDISVKLNEVAIADKNHIYMSAGIKLPEGYELLTAEKKIYIDGKKYTDMTTSGFTGYNKDNGISDIYYEIGLNKDIDLNRNLNIRIKIDSMMITDMKTHENKTVNGNWEFSFMASGQELLLDTEHYKIDKAVTAGDEKVKFTDLAINKIDQTIYAEIIEKGKQDKDYRLEGTDNLGNKVVFDLRESDGKNLYFKAQKNKINENATELNITVKSMDFPEQSGKLDHTQMKDAGSFTVKLK